MADEVNSVDSRETMLERGKFSANGYTFEVRPVYLGEEDDYLSEVGVSPVPVLQDGENLDKTDDKKMAQWSIALFSKSLNGERKKRGRIAEFFLWLFGRRDYRYYKDYPSVQPIIKWIERKVTYRGRRIRFYDLERKYGLSKADIERLFVYFHELSFF